MITRTHADGSREAARLVEVEAYLGDGSDPGSHCHRGRTPRNASMFGPAGHFYTYLSYGVHVCANLVTQREGEGAGILLRAAEPLLGVERMQARRKLGGQRIDRRLAGGPGRLAQALGLLLAHDGVTALRGEWTIRPAGAGIELEVGPRIGLSKGADLPLRFSEAGSPWRSR